MKTALVLTTINLPSLLLDYADNFEKYKHNKKEIDFIVIGDFKTPAGTEKIIKEIKERGFKGIYFNVSKQKKWLRRFPELDKIIPYNSDNRRNIGYLLAKERGAKIIISIDDDNWPQKDQDFLTYHQIVDKEKKMKAVYSKNGWYNICRHLTVKPDVNIYSRGFPLKKRKDDTQQFKEDQGRVVMNTGLWLKEPDADAFINLTAPVEIKSTDKKQYMFYQDIYCPINTQNTAFHIDILPCIWYVKMEKIAKNKEIGRYGDIWLSFFAEKVIHHMKDKITFGRPVTLHKRNEHNLLKDLERELPGIILTEKLEPILMSIKLDRKTYRDSYWQLVEKLEKEIEKTDFSEPERNYFKNITSYMKTWIKACDKINETN